MTVVREAPLARWIAHEFQYLHVPLRTATSLAEAMPALLNDAPRTIRVLIVYLDELSPPELQELLRLRPSGWRDELVAISRYRMAPALRRALGVNRLLTPPFVQDLFGDILEELGRRDAQPDHPPGVAATRRMTTGSSSP